MSRTIVATALVLGLVGGYVGASRNARATPVAPEAGRYAPTLTADSDGSVRHFCLTDTSTGDTVCTEGFQYDYCLDETGKTSTECPLPERRYYVMDSLLERR